MMKQTTASKTYTPTSGSRKKRTACRMNIVAKTHLRPIASESQAQKNLPRALPTEIMLTRPAATTALTPAISSAIGAASVMMEMPALTFRKRSAHSTYHCQVLKTSLRSPALRRVPHEERRAHDHDQVHDAEDGESREHADRGDERIRYKRRHEGATAEARHRDAGDKAALVGEPLDERGDRHDVAETDAHTAQEPIGQVEQREAVLGEARQEDPGPVEDARGKGHYARSRLVQQEPNEE